MDIYIIYGYNYNWLLYSSQIPSTFTSGSAGNRTSSDLPRCRSQQHQSQQGELTSVDRLGRSSAPWGDGGTNTHETH